MKKENYIIIALIAILILVILSIFIRNYTSFKDSLEIASNPFNTLEILDEKVRLKENERTYSIEVDCSTIIDENTQLVYYQLAEPHKKSTITVTSKIYKNNEVITSNYKEATNIETIISVFDNKKIYEQIYHINATCKNVNLIEENEDKDDSNNQTNTTKKPTTQKKNKK